MGAQNPWWLILYCGTQHLWVLSRMCHVSLLAPTILRKLLNFSDICVLLLKFTPLTLKWSLPFKSPIQNPKCISLPPTCATLPAHPILLHFIILIQLLTNTNHEAPQCAVSSSLLSPHQHPQPMFLP